VTPSGPARTHPFSLMIASSRAGVRSRSAAVGGCASAEISRSARGQHEALVGRARQVVHVQRVDPPPRKREALAVRLAERRRVHRELALEQLDERVAMMRERVLEQVGQRALVALVPRKAQVEQHPRELLPERHRMAAAVPRRAREARARHEDGVTARDGGAHLAHGLPRVRVVPHRSSRR